PTVDDFIAVAQTLRTASPAAALTFAQIRTGAPTVSASKLRVVLTVLKGAGLLREQRGSRYQLMSEVSPESLQGLASAYDERRQRDHAKLEQMVIYAQTALCRTRLLLAALGEEPPWERCDACDNCRGTATRPVA